MKSEIISIRPDARVKSNGCHGTLEREEWRPIKGYEGLYEVSSFGRVRSLDRIVSGRNGSQRNLKGAIMSYSCTSVYPKVTLYNGKSKTFSVHRLVAEAFIPNPDNLPCVNHRNEQPDCNYPDNLEWCNTKYNLNYGTHNKKISLSKKGHRHSPETRKKLCQAQEKKRIPVIQFSIEGKWLGEFESLTAAALSTGVNHRNIRLCCRGERHTAGGYVWKYK